MGTIGDGDIITMIQEFDCAALSAMWDENGQWSSEPSSGLEPPSGGLRGTAMLINVQRGTLYSFVASALTEFSDIQQHTAPSELIPDLTSAHDEGTENGATKSIVCNESECIEDTWERSVDAVAATLMAHSLSGEFSIESNIGADSEAILTFPLRKIYFDESNESQGHVRIDLFVHDRNGDGERGTHICAPILDTQPCNAPYKSSTLDSVNVLSFKNSVTDFESTVISGILAEEHTSFFPSPEFPIIPESGQFDFYLPVPLPMLLISNSGRHYFGNPVMGVVLQEFTNGHLTNEAGQLVRATYGNVFQLSKKKERTE
jgi:hypothetical protein